MRLTCALAQENFSIYFGFLAAFWIIYTSIYYYINWFKFKHEAFFVSRLLIFLPLAKAVVCTLTFTNIMACSVLDGWSFFYKYILMAEISFETL
jgi:hypothetical protein